jgi:hypothetical protein
VGRRHVAVLSTGEIVGGRSELEGRDDAVRGLGGDVLRIVEVSEDPGGVEVWADELAADCGDEAGKFVGSAAECVACVGIGVRESGEPFGQGRDLDVGVGGEGEGRLGVVDA